MSDNIKCPFCGSRNVSHTALGYGERVVTAIGAGAASLIPGAIGSIFNNHSITHAVAHGVMNTVPSEYKCKRCGKTFHANKNH